MFKNLMVGFLCFQTLFGVLSAADESEKEKVVQRLQDMTTAFNQDKEDSFASFWTEDSEFTNPVTGELVEGKEAIISFLKERAQEINKRQLKFSFKPEKVDFLDTDSAVAQGISEITDKNGELLQRNARKIELVKEDGQWYIDTVSEIEVPPAPPGYAHMKELEWLIGNWVDKDEDVTILFNTRWGKFKNFIVQEFKTEVYGVDEMEGIQIIGWDPIERKFRSWVYDSDGGFGSGLWTKNGDTWNVAMNYVLSDGRKATATQVYKPIDDKNYNFSSRNRTVEGEVLPEINPVTVVREE